jgi:UDP-N-acetylmuramoyl-tripeptide--D-alanyl-D-alanine ligase
LTTRWDDTGFRTRFEVRAADADIALELPLAGVHNVRNALAAVAVALALGIAPDAMRRGLASLKPVPRRLQPRLAIGGVRMIDDSYNANPDSVQAAIDVLMGLPGRHWLILGDLGELGPEAPALHRDIGAAARAAGVDGLFAVGELSAHAVSGFGAGARHFRDRDDLIAALRGALREDDLVLVKGSRLAAMDQIADALCVEGAG